MAAHARLHATNSGGGDSNDSDALAASVPLCLLHDLVGVAAFLASHPLHAAYLLFFARHLATLAAFFSPLLVSTALLLAVLATVGPHLGGAEWPGVRSLGRTCGIAVAALCAELQPDGDGGARLVGQLISFVLGPGDAAAVDRLEEITGDLCDITGSFFVLEEEKSLLLLLGGEECKEVAFAPPLMDHAIDERSFLDQEDSGEGKDGIDDKAVISEDFKGSESLAEQCCQNEARFVQEMEAEGEQEVAIQEQGSILSDMDDVGDAIVEKRLECDPLSVEIKKCEQVQAMELDVKKCKRVQTMEVKEFQPVESSGIESREPVKQRSSIAQRIKLWEAHVSGDFKIVIEDEEDISVKFSLESDSIKDVKKCGPFEADPGVETCDHKLKAQGITSKKESVEQEHDQEFKDVKECIPSEAETFNEICSGDMQAEENAPASHTDQVLVQPEAVLQEKECRAAQAEQDMQAAQTEQDMKECQVAQPEQDLQEMEEEYKDVTESPVMCNERESSLKSTSIAGRVHSRTSSENLISEGSPSQKEKEWKRTLACKLYEERMQLRLCRDRAVVEGSDNMDMLWEAYEIGGGSGSGVKKGGIKVKSSKKVEELVEEDEEKLEEQDDDDDEGSVRQLCCLQALKFSTKKMSFRGGRPSLAKISKVLKRMTALSRVGSRRSQKG